MKTEKTKVAKLCNGLYWAQVGKVEMFLNLHAWIEDFYKLKCVVDECEKYIQGIEVTDDIEADGIVFCGKCGAIKC